MEISKHDWKLFMEKIGQWQESYMDKLTTVIAKKKGIKDTISCKTETKLVEKLSNAYDELDVLYEKLIADKEKAESMTDSLAEAKFYQATIIEDMNAIRAIADEVEKLLPADELPYPSYADMLFYV